MSSRILTFKVGPSSRHLYDLEVPNFLIPEATMWSVHRRLAHRVMVGDMHIFVDPDTLSAHVFKVVAVLHDIVTIHQLRPHWQHQFECAVQLSARLVTVPMVPLRQHLGYTNWNYTLTRSARVFKHAGILALQHENEQDQ